MAKKGFGRTDKEETKRNMEWNLKQSKQRRQTLNQKHVRHDQERQDQLKAESKAYREEYKRLKDLLVDGK